MVRNIFAFALLLGLSAPAAVLAQSVQDSVVAQLQAQGFSEFTVSRTLLGRIQVTARRGSLKRELVFNPTTGEILRDYWEEDDDNDQGGNGVRILDPSNDDDRSDDSGSANTDDRSGSDSNSGNDDDHSGSNSGSANDDDNDDDGSGSNSGSGNSGSDDKDDDQSDDHVDDDK